MEEEVIQMVDDDEIENVGIMSGFMDELEELISEIDAEDLENSKGGDEADTAKLMGRTPDSPEILMNNLRGDMRGWRYCGSWSCRKLHTQRHSRA